MHHCLHIDHDKAGTRNAPVVPVNCIHFAGAFGCRTSEVGQLLSIIPKALFLEKLPPRILILP